MAEMQQRSAAEASRAEFAAQAAGAVVVEIYDQVYQLRGTDAAYIEKLAGIVDGKMRAVSAHGATVDSLRVAVLAALNIADEYHLLKKKQDGGSTDYQKRAHLLADALDKVLGDGVPGNDRKAS